MTAVMSLRDLCRVFPATTLGGSVTALDHVNIDFEPEEFVVALGASGCGKTTLLNVMAGFLPPTSGAILLHDNPITGPGRDRGVVFQKHALFPWMNVIENTAFGLKLQGVSPDEIKQRAAQVLDLVGLEGLEERYPAQLSGGQQQRVALARALVRNPKVLLLDEPLSNLDAKLREKMRFEIKSLVRRMGITSVYVTHDQAEAMVISDRIAVMEAGNVVQVGTPEDIYDRPANKFVADFIGTTNFIAGKVAEVAADGTEVVLDAEFGAPMRCRTSDARATEPGLEAAASIRPEDVEVLAEPDPDRPNVYPGTIAHKAYLGNFLYFFVDVSGTMIRVQVPHYLPQGEGEQIYLHLNPEKSMILF